MICFGYNGIKIQLIIYALTSGITSAGGSFLVPFRKYSTNSMITIISTAKDETDPTTIISDGTVSANM